MATSKKSKSKGNRGGNPIELLKADHRKVEDLISQYEEAGEDGGKKKQRIAEKVFQELEVHSSIEEEIFYPAVREGADKKGRELVGEALKEHKAVKNLIQELREMDPEDDQFEAKFTHLAENVNHHVEEEEDEMFPIAQDALGERAADIARRLKERKKELMREAA